MIEQWSLRCSLLWMSYTFWILQVSQYNISRDIFCKVFHASNTNSKIHSSWKNILFMVSNTCFLNRKENISCPFFSVNELERFSHTKKNLIVFFDEYICLCIKLTAFVACTWNNLLWKVWTDFWYFDLFSKSHKYLYSFLMPIWKSFKLNSSSLPITCLNIGQWRVIFEFSLIIFR